MLSLSLSLTLSLSLSVSPVHVTPTPTRTPHTGSCRARRPCTEAYVFHTRWQPSQQSAAHRHCQSVPGITLAHDVVAERAAKFVGRPHDHQPVVTLVQSSSTSTWQWVAVGCTTHHLAQVCAAAECVVAMVGLAKAVAASDKTCLASSQFMLIECRCVCGFTSTGALPAGLTITSDSHPSLHVMASPLTPNRLHAVRT